MKKVKKFFCLFFIFYFLWGIEPEVKNNYDFAIWLMQEGDYVAAITEFRRCLHFSCIPEEQKYDVVFNIGFCYYKLENYQKAIQIWQELYDTNFINKRKNERYYQLKYFIGNAHFLNQDYESALRCYETLMNEHNAYQEKASFMTFLCLLKQNKVAEAKNKLEKFVVDFSVKGELIRNAERILPYLIDLLKIKRKSPVISTFLSSIFPGSGQMYCKRYGDGIFTMSINLIFGTMAYTANLIGSDTEKVVYPLIFLFFYSGNIYGAYTSAKNYNDTQNFLLLKKIEKNIPYDKLLLK